VPFTRDVEWTAERNRLLTTYFPTRTDFLVSLLRRNLLYPELDAPVFDTHGGRIPPGFTLRITAPEGAIYYTLDGTDPRRPGDVVSPTAILLGAPEVPIRDTTMVQARALDIVSGEWSALEKALFWLDVPLRITELMYHPRDAEGDEAPDDDEFEYVELQNVGDEVVELAGFRLEGAISFEFSAGFVDRLEPGEVVLVIRDMEAFASRYDIAQVLIAGEYSGHLSNAGERVVLSGPAGEPILDFEFRDDWHPTTDGDGASLIVIDPLAASESWSEGASWRPSDSIDGTPGFVDGPPPVGGWQLPGDANQDGVLNLSDGLRDLQLLFVAQTFPLPCDGPLTSAGNRTVLDANGDDEFNLSDPIYLLSYLFLGGPPPVAGTDCRRIEACGNACAE